MEPEFWHTRWRQGQLGFHRTTVHEQLLQHENKLHALATRPRVLVPLCGKTLDMTYLQAQGVDVVGVELSTLAARAFFEEHALTPDVATVGKFEKYSNGGITILCGDFFDASPQDVGPVHAAYDRAALVALPPALRTRYVEHLATLLPNGAPVLLISFEYPQGAMAGPPFSVPPSDVDALFASRFDITRLESRDVLDDNERFRDRLNDLQEQTYLLKRRV